MARLYLVRHGTHDLVGKVLAGRRPGVNLSAAGRAQAAALATHFQPDTVASICCSPMERCLETAAPIAAALGLPIAVDEALNEIDCGSWTDQSFDALAEDPRWIAWNNERGSSAPPGGESTRSVQARITAAMDGLVEADGDAALFVTHSDVIKLAVQTLLGAPLDWHDRLQVDPASITTFDLWRGGGRVVRLNQAVGP